MSAQRGRFVPRAAASATHDIVERSETPVGGRRRKAERPCLLSAPARVSEESVKIDRLPSFEAGVCRSNPLVPPRAQWQGTKKAKGGTTDRYLWTTTQAIRKFEFLKATVGQRSVIAFTKCASASIVIFRRAGAYDKAEGWLPRKIQSCVT